MKCKSFFFSLISAVSFTYAETSPDIISVIHDYSVAFAAIGLLLMASYSGYKHMFSQDPLEKKDAWETLSYALVGVTLVISAKVLAGIFGGN